MKNHRGFRRHALATAALLALTPAAFAADYHWTTGTYSPGVTSPNPIAATDTLFIDAGGYKYLNSALANNGSIKASDNLYFQNGNVLTNTGLFDWTNDSSFIDGGYNGGLTNSGIFRKSGGAGTSYVGISGFSNSGTVDVQTGTIAFNSGAVFDAGSKFTGAGQAVVTNGASFNGAFTSQNLSLSGGTFTGSSAQVNGTVNWTAGYLNGSWEVATGQTLNVAGGGYKYMNGALANNGTVALTDNLYFSNGNVVTNNKTIALQGDVSLLDGGYNGGVTNNGTFRKSAGTGTSYVSISGFASTGVIDVQTGTLNFNTGASFGNGSQFTGAGQAEISSGASFAGTLKTAANLSLTGGTFTGTGAKVDGDVRWTGGTLAGDWQVLATRTLTIDGGGYKYLNGSLGNKGVVLANDNLYFTNGNTLTNDGVYKANGDIGLLDGGYQGYFVNNGTFGKTAGTGTSYVSITGFQNKGTIDAKSGTIEFNAGAVFDDGSKFTGAGAVAITAGATFNGAFTTAANLSLANGTFTGNAARIDGDTVWSGGTFAGGWEVASGRTLSLTSGGYKYLNGSLANKGTMLATDNLYLQNGNTLTNQGAYQAQGDVGLNDGGYQGYFVNNGTFSKTAGTGTSYVAITGFQNNGTVEAKTGTIEFNSGALFDDGSQFTGAGRVVVSAGANFRGGLSTAGNLTLSAGTFVGGDGTAGSKATLTSGGATWTSGYLTGTWDVAAGQTLTLATGGYKYIGGTVSSSAKVAAADNLYLQNGNTFTNKGTYVAQGDVGVYDGGYNGNFVNAGTFVKSTGTGNTDVSQIAFTNPGTVDVQTGTIVLPNNFVNTGLLKGVGSLQTNLLTNSGHVAPGESPGTLTIAGNFAQTALGSFDVETGGLGYADKLVVQGSAALGGTLALSCFGTCSYAVGDTFTILDANANSLSGTFAQVTYAGYQTGQFQVIYDLADGDVLLKVTQATSPIAAVPEPATWATMFAGLGMLVMLTRRRLGRREGAIRSA